MATKKVNIDITARDKSKAALRGVRGSLDSVKKSIFNVRNAFIGLGAGLVIRGIVKAGIQIENLGVQLEALFGSAEKGQAALDKVTKFAKSTPFELSNIQQGVTALATVAEKAESLGISFEELLKITGNTAVQLGGDFAVASQQIQRAFSAGIGSADLFRDKAVTAMAGFSAGVKVSVDESIKGLSEAFGTGGKFGDLTEKLAQTLSGTISNLKDALFTIQTQIASGFFDELKRQLGDLKKFLEQNEEAISSFSRSVGENIGGALIKIVKFGKLAADNMVLFGAALLGITAMLSPQLAVISALGISIAYLADVFKDAKLAAIGINEELGKLGYNELTAKLRDLNAELEKNNKEIIEQQVLAVMRQETDAMGMGIAENLIKLEKAKNELIHKQIGIIKNLIEVRKADIEIIQLNEHAILSLGETEVKVLEKTMAVHKEYAMFAKIAARDLEIIREEARVKELEANEKHNKDLKNLEEQRYSHNLAELKSRNYNFEELDKMSNENKMNLAKASGRELLGELAKSNKAAFAINKAFAIKDAIVSTAQGITAALKMGPFGIPLAVMIGGLGAVQIATIAKQEYTGRQLGGKVNKGQPYMVGESGREMFVPNQSGNIVPNHDLKQGVNVNFNINTVDASGFNQLLVNSRGVIINMINSAVNEKGRAAII